jgi:LmbE family N-acetylglucosaminyl deacetylase
MKLFVSPHNDDETLFGAFTLLREQPLVVVVFDGWVQAQRGLGVTAEQRRAETRAACAILGVEVEFLGFSDANPPCEQTLYDQLNGRYRNADVVYAPATESGGHGQHNLVSSASSWLVANANRREYCLTYTKAGKSTSERKVAIEDPKWIGLKLRALACYESQFDPRLGCQPHFIGRSLEEYYA